MFVCSMYLVYTKYNTLFIDIKKTKAYEIYLLKFNQTMSNKLNIVKVKCMEKHLNLS